MFMLLLTRVAPALVILSWDFFKSIKNFFAVSFGNLDFCMIDKAFWRSGSVGRVDNICFAEVVFGCRR